MTLIGRLILFTATVISLIGFSVINTYTLATIKQKKIRNIATTMLICNILGLIFVINV